MYSVFLQLNIMEVTIVFVIFQTCLNEHEQLMR